MKNKNVDSTTILIPGKISDTLSKLDDVVRDIEAHEGNSVQILIERGSKNRPGIASRIYDHTSTNLMYMASIAKVLYAVFACKWFEEQDLDLKKPIFTFEWTDTHIANLLDKKDNKDAFYTYRGVLKNTTLAKKVAAALQHKSPARALEKLDLQTIFSLRELITLMLGPSSNAALTLLVDYFHKKEGSGTLQNAVQVFSDRLLTKELGVTKPQLIFNSTDKEKNGPGYWNCAPLWEIYALIQLVFDRDSRLGISSRAFDLIHSAMKETANTLIELGKNLHDSFEVIEKAGWDPNNETKWWEAYPEFIAGISLQRATYFATYANIARVTRDNKSDYLDFAYAVRGFSHDQKANDTWIDTEIKPSLEKMLAIFRQITEKLLVNK